MLLPRAAEPPLIRCGAIGTNLYGTGASGGPVEGLNTRDPQRVLALYQAYVDAGARALVTNTYAANRLSLAEHGLADECAALNQAGVEVARAAAASECQVWGCIGPLSLGFRADDYSPDELTRIYVEQCEHLRAADALVLETFVGLREAQAALQAARATGLPVIMQVGRLTAGAARHERLRRLVEEAEACGAVALGANCQHPTEIQRTLRELAQLTDLPLAAAPNAGNAQIERGAVTYEFGPGEFAEVSRKLADLGAAVIGGCCGTTPDHVRSVDAALKPALVPARPAVAARVALAGTGPALTPPAANRVRDVVTAERPLISVEIRADRKRTLAEIVEGARTVAAAGVDLFDVPDNPAASVGRDACVVAAAVQEATGVPTIPHVSVTHSNVLRLHSGLIGAWDLGLRGLLALTGDSPSMGPFGDIAKRTTDLRSSVELLRLVASLRNGELLNGDTLGDPPDFCAGCVTRGGGPQLRWLQQKMAAGAEFVFTQPVFDEAALRAVGADLAVLSIRAFVGVLPVTSHRMAETLSSGRVPGIDVPPALVDELARRADRAAQRRYGLERALVLARAAFREHQGLYLIMPFGPSCYTDTAEIIRGVRG